MKGIVYKSTGSWYLVKTADDEYYDCRIKGKFRIQNIKNTNPISVGDYVEIEITEKDNDKTIGIIKKIYDRKNYIIRKSVNLSKQTHIIASNIDLAFLIVTHNNPPTHTTFIDRFLVTAQAYDIETVLLFNKIDTYTEEELDQINYLDQMYSNIGYSCIHISAKQGYNLEQIKSIIKGKTCMFSGHSGVGKSTLINAINPELNLKTANISQQHNQGQHTTTFAQMYDLSENSRVIDTPGIKGFGIVEIDKEELSDYFPEFFELKSECKFNNCLHQNEPHCAVKKALDNQEISWSRYESYLQILQGDEQSNTHYRQNYYEN